MQDLKVVGVENGALVLAAEDGTRFRVTADEQLQSKVRQAIPTAGVERKLAPREIQAHIRAGMSAEDVAAVTGASLEYIRRFEGPVLAEREYVVESALNVTVHTALDTDPLAGGATFGSVIRQRLADAGATGERWASWKEQGGGWIVKLEFVAETVERDARWSYEPRTQSLSPLNAEAISLSQQGDMPQGLIPRLRAVTTSETGESHRFDSGAFAVDEMPEGNTVDASGITRAPEPAMELNETADLLEALRRRRGERETAEPVDQEAMAMHPSTGSIRIVDVPLDGFGDGPNPTAELPAGSQQTGSQSGAPVSAIGASSSARGAGRKGRASMPSWDEIVFGARSDDDLS